MTGCPKPKARAETTNAFNWGGAISGRSWGEYVDMRIERLIGPAAVTGLRLLVSLLLCLGVLAAARSSRADEPAARERRALSLSSAAGEIMAIEPGDLHVTERLNIPERGADFDIVRFSPVFLSNRRASWTCAPHFISKPQRFEIRWCSAHFVNSWTKWQAIEIGLK